MSNNGPDPATDRASVKRTDRRCLLVGVAWGVFAVAGAAGGVDLVLGVRINLGAAISALTGLLALTWWALAGQYGGLVRAPAGRRKGFLGVVVLVVFSIGLLLGATFMYACYRYGLRQRERQGPGLRSAPATAPAWGRTACGVRGGERSDSVSEVQRLPRELGVSGRAGRARSLGSATCGASAKWVRHVARDRSCVRHHDEGRSAAGGRAAS